MGHKRITHIKAKRAVLAGNMACMIVMLSGCVSVNVYEAWTPQGRYVCEDGKSFMVELIENGAAVRVTTDAAQFALPQTGGATDAKFTDGRTTLYVDGNRAFLEEGAQVYARGCVKR